MPATSEILAAEFRRQIDHQIDAAKSMDTRATALIAGAATVATLVVPRVHLDRLDRILAAAGVAGLLFATFVFLALAIRPRKAAFSYGPDVNELLRHIDLDPDSMERVIADSLAQVRAKNERVLEVKGHSLVVGLGLLISTVIGLGVVVVVGGIQ